MQAERLERPALVARHGSGTAGHVGKTTTRSAMTQKVVEMAAPVQDDAILLNGRRTTIALQIYRSLRQKIVAGDYPPLHPLSEGDLATSFGVSRTPIREALGKLEEERLISIVPQYGTFVSPILVDRVASDQFVREALECAAIALATTRCDDNAAAMLRGHLKAQRACTTERAFFEADDAMHRALMVLAGHEVAWQVVDAAKVNLDRIRLLAVRHTFKRQSILLEHDRIIRAVIARDEDAAVTAMRAHLRGVFESSAQMMAMYPEFFQNADGDPRPARKKRTAAMANIG